MDADFGARLRAQREQQQIPLSTIAERMKIRLSLLEQLESGKVGSWPKGIFGRAYLRDYARAIGLDSEAVVREFQELYPDTPLDPFSVAAAEKAAAESAPPTGLKRLVTAAISAMPGRPRRDGQPPVMHAAIVPLPAPETDLGHNGDFTLSPPTNAAADRRRGHDRRRVNLSSAAELCGRLARASDSRDVTTLLVDAVALLDAVGAAIWLWDAAAMTLRPSLAHGYTADVLESLPSVRADESNAIAAAFRTGTPSIVDGGGETTGAVVAPSVGPSGCVGVLALEVRDGSEHHEAVKALAMLLAAQLGTLLPSPLPAPVPSQGQG